MGNPELVDCPNCASEVPAPEKITKVPVALDTDCRPIYLGDENPLDTEFSHCRACGFAGNAKAFESGALPAHVRRKIGKFLEPRKESVGSETAFLAIEMAALIREWEDAPAFEVGMTFLKAAWIARDLGNHNKERLYQREAVMRIEQALEIEELTLQETPEVQYLVGEIHQRLNRKQRGQRWFERAQDSLQEVLLDAEPQLRKELAPLAEALAKKLPQQDLEVTRPPRTHLGRLVRRHLEQDRSILGLDKPYLAVEHAAIRMQSRGNSCFEVGLTYLKAAALARDFGDRLNERKYMREAVRDFEIALELDETNRNEVPEMQYFIGDIHLRLNRPMRARSWFKRAEESLHDALRGADPEERRQFSWLRGELAKKLRIR